MFKNNKAQTVVFFMVCVGCALVGMLLFQNNANRPRPYKQLRQPKLPITKIRQMVDQTTIDSDRTTHELHLAEKQRQHLDKKIRAISNWVTLQKQQGSEVLSVRDDMRQEISALKKQLQQIQAKTKNEHVYKRNIKPKPRVTPITETRFKTAALSRSKHVKNRYVPAGSFAQAVILGGLDAQAGVLSRANPRPVILKLTHPVQLPNQRTVDLSGCFLTAAAVGDVSSERAYIRLERLSCAEAGSPILDVPVYGTVFGPSGKDGVRGAVVWRERRLLQGAMLAGVFSGLANGVSQGYTTQALSPLGETKSIKASKILQFGAAQGTTSALGRLAEYRIKRAEQYQPVIQVNAGIAVDVVFLKGVNLTPQAQQRAKTASIRPYALPTVDMPIKSIPSVLQETPL